MKALPLNKLDIYNAGRNVYCHPSIYPEVVKHIHKMTEKENVPSYIYRPNHLNIYTNPLLKAKEESGEWERTNVMPDTNLVQWIDNMEDPPSWAITWRMVKRKETYVVYIVNDISIRFRYDLLMFKEKTGILINSSI